jgi:trehalose-phosphatase
MTAPSHLLRHWKQIERRLRRARRVALFTDFDGTLVPIRRHPSDVWLSNASRLLLERLARRGVLVGVISGRPLDDIGRRVGVPGIWYVGAHGFSLRGPANRIYERLNLKEKKKIARARQLLVRRLAGLPGIALEDKEAMVGVHYRQASASVRDSAWSAVEQVMRQVGGLHLLAGKKVWELFPRRPNQKWMALQSILRQESRARARQGWEMFYLGDDTTDELVFEELRGWSVAVGKRRRTAARYFLNSPAEVSKFLRRLAEVV